MTNNFWEEKLIQGYYDKILKKGLKKTEAYRLLGITQYF
jgi:hypothetical protein